MSGDIFHAAKRGDAAALKDCICNVNSKDQFQRTPLHYATERGHTEIVQILIQAGAVVNVKDIGQRIPLHNAATYGHKDIVHILIQAGADIDAKDWYQSTPLDRAAVKGHPEIVQILRHAGANINVKDYVQSTPLLNAAGEGYTMVVQILIQAGAEVNVKNMYQSTPLHNAAMKGHTDIVRILKEAGADVNVKDGNQSTPLHNAAYRRNTGIMQILIQAGADVNVKDKYQSTPLHKAAMKGHTDIVRILIEAGADVNVKDGNQSTPLHNAADRRNTGIMQILIQAGADVNVKDKFLLTLLYDAMKTKNTKMVEVLLQARVDINASEKILLDKMVHLSQEIRSVVEEFEDFMQKVPKEVRILGEQAIYLYANALRKDSLISNVIRVMLVGHFGVGKTTIAMNLLGRTEYNISSTDGIDVFINQCLYDIEKGTWQQNEDCSQTLFGVKHFIRLDLTDFAGQLIFYTTHQTYLTSRGLYLLVFNLALGLEGVVDDEDLYPRKSQHRRMIDFLEYWIAMIVTYARSEQEHFPRIILIGTHRDQIENESEIRRIKEMIQENFKDLINSSQVILRDELFIKAKGMSDETRTLIRDVILEEGKKYKEFGEPVPSSWIALQEKLMEMKKKKQIIMQFGEIKQMSSEINVPLADEELKVFLKVLHNMGYGLYFDLSTLDDKVILDQKLVIDAMRSFITCERFILRPWKQMQFKQMRQSGRIKISHVNRMLKEDSRSDVSEHSEYLLAVMEELDLICLPMCYSNGKKVSPDFYLVPCMMSADMPLAPVEELNRASGLIITFSSERILPPAIFNRLVCSCLSLWEIQNNHFYNGLVVLRSGKFHLMEMKREIKQIVVTLAHNEYTKRPDAEWCLAIKLFLAATIERIVAAYSTTLGSPIICNSSELDDILRDVKTKGKNDVHEKEKTNCECQVFERRPLKDVNLMRIAQQLQGIDLPILCTVLLNNADFAQQIQKDCRGLNSDVMSFYALQKWKKSRRVSTVASLKCVLKCHLENFNEHVICQAMKNEMTHDIASTNAVLNVYEEFLHITADRITYEFIQLGLELGLNLADIERLRIEKDSVLEITRTMLQKWHNESNDEATFLRLASALNRCGLRNLGWMDEEFDVEKSKNNEKKHCIVS